MLQASHDAPQNQTPCVETFHNRENKQTTVGNLVAGRHGPGRQAVAPGRTGASRGRTGVPRENRAQECQESHRAGMSRTGKHGKNRSSGVVFLGATPPDRKGVSCLDAGACHGSHWTPELRWTPGNPEPRRTHWTPGSPEPPGKPRQPRAARKARDPGLSGLARRGHNQG